MVLYMNEGGPGFGGTNDYWDAVRSAYEASGTVISSEPIRGLGARALALPVTGTEALPPTQLAPAATPYEPKGRK